MAVRYGTVRYVDTVRFDPTFAKKYSMLVRYAFFVMVRVRYIGTVRLSCNGTRGRVEDTRLEAKA